MWYSIPSSAIKTVSKFGKGVIKSEIPIFPEKGETISRFYCSKCDTYDVERCDINYLEIETIGGGWRYVLSVQNRR